MWIETLSYLHSIHVQISTVLKKGKTKWLVQIGRQKFGKNKTYEYADPFSHEFFPSHSLWELITDRNPSLEASVKERIHHNKGKVRSTDGKKKLRFFSCISKAVIEAQDTEMHADPHISILYRYIVTHT